MFDVSQIIETGLSREHFSVRIPEYQRCVYLLQKIGQKRRSYRDSDVSGLTFHAKSLGQGDTHVLGRRIELDSRHFWHVMADVAAKHRVRVRLNCVRRNSAAGDRGGKSVQFRYLLRLMICPSLVFPDSINLRHSRVLVDSPMMLSCRFSV